MRQITHLIIGDKIWQPVWVPDRQKWTIALTGKDGEVLREAKEFGEFSYKVQAITRFNELHMQGKLTSEVKSCGN